MAAGADGKWRPALQPRQVGKAECDSNIALSLAIDDHRRIRVEHRIEQHAVGVVLRIAGQHDGALQPALRLLHRIPTDAVARERPLVALVPLREQCAIAQAFAVVVVRHPYLPSGLVDHKCEC